MEQAKTPAQTGEGEADVRRQRQTLMVEIAASFVVAAGLWIGIGSFMPPIVGADGLAARLIFAFKLCCVAILFCLATGVEAVAHERLQSPAIDPLSAYTTRRMTINLRYLQNTLEQLVIFVPGLLGLAFYASDGRSMRAVVAAAVVWMVSRFAFWIGYHRGSTHRGAGAPGMLQSLLILLYVCARFGRELAGIIGEIIPIIAFAGIEAYLFLATTSDDKTGARSSAHDRLAEAKLTQFQSSIDACMACLDDFMAAFNARDLTAWQKTFNFPSVRLASNTMVIINPGDHKPEMFGRGALAEWDHSAWDRREIIHAGVDKVHIDTQFTRYRADGSVIGGFNSVYVVTCEDGHWGIKARSSFAP